MRYLLNPTILSSADTPSMTTRTDRKAVTSPELGSCRPIKPRVEMQVTARRARKWSKQVTLLMSISRLWSTSPLSVQQKLLLDHR